MAKSRNRMDTGGGDSLSSNPFAALNANELPSGPAAHSQKASDPPSASAKGARSRGRVDVRRETSGRGGKTVTVAYGFVGISAEEKADLAKSIQKRCGTGGAVKSGQIEIQGDKREEVRSVLESAGFRVVFAGG